MDGWEQWKGNSEHDHKAVLCGCLYVCAYGDLLKRPLVVLCVLPQSPRQAWQTGRLLKHIRSCCSSDSLSFSRMRSTWIWAVSVSVCLSPPPNPIPPALCACQSVEGAHRIFLLRCVSLSYAFPSQPLDSLCLHLSLHKNGQGVFSFLTISLHTWTANWPVDRQYVPRSATKVHHH